MGEAARHRLSWWGALLVLAACGDSPDEGSSANPAGSGGATSSESGGASGAPTSGTGGSSGSGAGTTGAGGTAGSTNAMPTDGDLGRLANPTYDMTLDGFNQDLPAPTMPCEVSDVPIGVCITVSGVYDDQAFDVKTFARSAYVYLEGGSRQAGADIELGMDDTLYLATIIGMQTAPIAPSSFEFPAPGVDPGNSFVLLQRETRNFESHDAREPLATHDIESRFAGEFWFTQRADDAPLKEQVLAYFAASMTPKAGCSPDADGFGCDTIRLRGMIIGETLRALAAP